MKTWKPLEMSDCFTKETYVVLKKKSSESPWALSPNLHLGFILDPLGGGGVYSTTRVRNSKNV